VVVVNKPLLYITAIHTKENIVGFEVFTAVVMKSIFFWDMTPCSPLSFNRRFGGIYRLHVRSRRNKFSKNRQASRWQVSSYRKYYSNMKTLANVGIPRLIKLPKVNCEKSPFTGHIGQDVTLQTFVGEVYGWNLDRDTAHPDLGSS
jgi:hypothetical protein